MQSIILHLRVPLLRAVRIYGILAVALRRLLPPPAGPIPVKWSTAGTKTVVLTVTLGTCSTTYTDTVHVQNYGAVSTVQSPKSQVVKIVPNPNHGRL